MAEFSAKEIARWFLARNNVNVLQYDDELLTHLKLQKLLYYAQGVFLAYKGGEALFGEDIMAWEHGPVVPEVYQQYKSCGREGIEFNPTEDDREILRKVDQDEDVQNVLEMVFDHYGKYTAWHLREMTHSEKPWRTTTSNAVITKGKIQQYFEEEVLTD